MEIRQNLRSVPSRPVVLVIAILSLLALAVTAWSVLAAGTGSHRGTGTGQSVTSTLGPDAQERNQLLRHQMEDTTHGH
ncbi:MAG TPA: hypothetical protein VGS16_10310 [Candidatus Dormibacteraeota bacterium]|nr:hypothetical protein [Candidatus Dormibacteraeota bacterium]